VQPGEAFTRVWLAETTADWLQRQQAAFLEAAE
jgi:hypothetical protein